MIRKKDTYVVIYEKKSYGNLLARKGEKKKKKERNM